MLDLWNWARRVYVRTRGSVLRITGRLQETKGRFIPPALAEEGPGWWLSKIRSAFPTVCLCETERSLLKLRRAFGPGTFHAGKLLNLMAVFRASRVLAGIETAFLVRRKDIFDYRAWLTRFPGLGTTSTGRPTLGPLVVAADSSVWDAIQDAGLTAGVVRDRLLAKTLGVVMHEVGHAVLGHVAGDKFSRTAPSVALWFASPRSLEQEFEAWMYSGMMRAFVFAEVAGEKRPDRVPDLV